MSSSVLEEEGKGEREATQLPPPRANECAAYSAMSFLEQQPRLPAELAFTCKCAFKKIAGAPNGRPLPCCFSRLVRFLRGKEGYI